MRPRLSAAHSAGKSGRCAQKRWAVATRGVSQPEDQAVGRGLWGDETTPAGLPKTAHWGVFQVPEYEYARRRYPSSVSIGIDLGTTNTCASYLDPDSQKPVVVPLKGKTTTPTVIGLNDDTRRYFGHEAVEMISLVPSMALCSGKRLLGKSLTDRKTPRDVYNDIMELIQTDAGIGIRLTKLSQKAFTSSQGVKHIEFPVVHVIAMFLRYLKTSAEDALRANVDSATISVPAHFSVAQRKATEDAAIIAGIDVKEIIDEPSAAALAYSELVAGTSFHEKEKGRVVVFDLGGGTFDIAVLDLDFRKSFSRIAASGGDDLLGGDDFDRVLIKYWLKELRKVAFNDELSHLFDSRVRTEATKAKIALDSSEEYRSTIPVFTNPIKIAKLPISITRFEYEELTKPLRDRMIECMNDIFDKAGIDPRAVDDILLVGEMTRSPAILKLAEDYFGRKPVFSDVATPGTVVALGAALRGGQIDNMVTCKTADNFVYDENSKQYERTLSGVSLLMHRAKKWWQCRQKFKKERPHEFKERVLAEKGLNDQQIAAMSKEVIEMETWMRKQVLADKIIKEAGGLMEDISLWKDPRQGFQDPELDELLEVLKFWTRVVEDNRKGEEQLAQACWELKFYFEELAGTTEKTALEQIAEDPEVRKLLDGDIAAPSRSFTKSEESSNDTPPNNATLSEDPTPAWFTKPESSEEKPSAGPTPTRVFTKASDA
ncbi:Chaperone protein DnaK [Diplonema papillatum]|nr:Chaperone protein DnaK [Diplonema papillatum]